MLTLPEIYKELLDGGASIEYADEYVGHLLFYVETHDDLSHLWDDMMKWHIERIKNHERS